MELFNNSKVFKQTETLPSLPATVTNVMSVIANPESSGDDLVNAILPDQAMCATILKIANSAFFGIPREVASMDKAVNVLGFNEVYNIVLGKAVFNSFQKINQTNKKVIDAFWQHAFHCGLTAKIIAEDLKCPPSELFIGGLIHDIGKLIFFMSQPSSYLPILEMENIGYFLNCSKAEQHQFNVDHGTVGLHLLTRWMFPERLLNAVGYHHYPENCHNNTLYAIIVQLSDALSVLVTQDPPVKITQLYTQITLLLPKSKELWEQHKLSIDDQQIQKWASALQASIEKDSAILSAFSS
jgi:putative nucleotidyltransferase with HDIG domain